MKSRLHPYIWSGLTFGAGLALTLWVAFHQKRFAEENQIVSPDLSPGPGIAYFFGVVVVMAIVLFFIPLDKLKYVFRFLFTLMFAWGAFVTSALVLPLPFAYAIAAIAGIGWLFWARVWLHNIVLLVALASAGSVFGFLFSPWAFLILMLVIAVYDFLAVKFGFMVWMVDRLSQTVSLPAFIYPHRPGEWAWDMKKIQAGELAEKKSAEREYSLLGGGDIGFPLMLVASVYFALGLAAALVVGGFALLGLYSAFIIQQWWLRGKPMPALPPIAVFSLIGFIVVRYGLVLAAG
ncbi:MAG: hypothetical protein N2506_01945 [Dehalococcoidales bacterium]|nr:hypothetical protein [Dehalococcoidales bacterium]